MWKMRTPTAAVLALSAASCRLRTSVFLAPASAAAREGRLRSSVVGSLLASPYGMNMSPFLVAMGSTERRSSSCTAASTFAGSQPCPAASALSSYRLWRRLLRCAEDQVVLAGGELRHFAAGEWAQRGEVYLNAMCLVERFQRLARDDVLDGQVLVSS